MANVNQQKLIQQLVEWAQRKNKNDITKPLTGIVDSIMENGFQEGRFLVSVNEAGGTAQFAAFDGYDGPAIIALVHQALEWLATQPNPAAPRTRGRILKRMVVSFRKTTFAQNVFKA